MLLAIINMLIIICCSYDFYSTFHVFDGAAYPYKLSRLLPLDPISHGNDGLFYYRTALSMEICDRIYYRHFPPDPLKSRSYQINSRGCWPEYLLSHTFKYLKLLHINSKDMIKNVGFKLFIKVIRRKNYVS